MIPHVPIPRLKEVWPEVERGINKIIGLCPAPWTALQVRRNLERGNSLLFACDDGFFVVERREDWGAFYLNVWLMYFKPGKGWPRKQELIKQLDSIKEELLCEFISFTSPRGKWSSMIEGDFKEHARIWRRE